MFAFSLDARFIEQSYPLPPHPAGPEARARRNSLGSLNTGQHLNDAISDNSGNDLNKLLLEGLKNRSARRVSLAWPPAAMTASIAGGPPYGSAEVDAEVKGVALQLAALSSQRSSVASMSAPAPNQRMHSPSKEPSHTSPQSQSYGRRASQSLPLTGNDVMTCRREQAASSTGRPATPNSPTIDDRLPSQAQLAAHADSRMPESGQGAGARCRARRPPARQGSNLAQVMSAACAAVEGTNAVASAQPLSSQQQLLSTTLNC